MNRDRSLWTSALQAGPIRPAVCRRTTGRARDLEWEQQVEVIDRFAIAHPVHAGLLIHIANGGSRRNAFEGWRLKRAGVRPGVSDLFLALPRGGHHGLWIEMKALGVQRPRATKDQERWLLRMTDLGYRAELCVGADAALQVLDDYLGGGV